MIYLYMQFFVINRSLHLPLHVGKSSERQHMQVEAWAFSVYGKNRPGQSSDHWNENLQSLGRFLPTPCWTSLRRGCPYGFAFLGLLSGFWASRWFGHCGFHLESALLKTSVGTEDVFKQPGQSPNPERPGLSRTWGLKSQRDQRAI